MMRIVSFILVNVIAGLCMAAAPWTLTTADFERRQVELIEIGPETVIVKAAGGEAVRVAMDTFLGLARTETAAQAAGPAAFTLHLHGGDRLVGAPAGVAGDILSWKTDAIGPVPVGLRSIAGLTRGTEPLPHTADARVADRVRLANGDVLEGLLADISDEGVALSVDGQIVPIPLDSIITVFFATAGAPAGPVERGFQVRLADGSTLGSTSLKTDGSSLVFTVAGEARTVPLAGVRSIDQVNGPVAWISDLPPAEVAQVPFIGESVPTRFNTTLDGRPIAVGEERFAKGIAVQPRSTLTWDLPAGYSAFRTQYAIEGDRPRANVTVRIRLDDRIVHEQADVVAGKVYDVVRADLAGARRLTLEVDYGKTYDVQDHFLWIEPALVR